MNIFPKIFGTLLILVQYSFAIEDKLKLKLSEFEQSEQGVFIRVEIENVSNELLLVPMIFDPPQLMEIRILNESDDVAEYIGPEYRINWSMERFLLIPPKARYSERLCLSEKYAMEGNELRISAKFSITDGDLHIGFLEEPSIKPWAGAVASEVINVRLSKLGLEERNDLNPIPCAANECDVRENSPDGDSR